jgi:major vault protein
VLSPSECDLYYPGNRVVRDINQSLRSSQANSINGVVEAEMERSFASAAVATSTLRKSATANAFADQLERGTTYTPPRTITLDTKYDGAVMINVWSGYAVQVVNSRGDRRTVIGPQSVLLEYDEHLEKLSLSTGTPKSDEQRLNTPYLRHISNPVSDIITLKTHDLVNVEVQVKYLVRFDPKDEDRWFTIDNYIQYMVDHLRSLIGNAVRNISVQDFYTDATSILRDLVLGKKEDSTGRPLKHFKENGMTVYDLEVSKVTVLDRNINEMLSNSRQQTLSEKIELDRASARLEITRGIQAARRDEAQAISETELLIQQLRSEENEAKSRVLMASVSNDGEIQRVRKANEKAAAELDAAVQGILQAIEQDRETMEQRFKDLDAERSIKVEEAMAAAHKVRMDAIGPKLIEAMTAMAQTGQLEAIAEHLAPLSIVQGESLSGTFTKLLRGTPLEGMLKNIEGLSLGRAA